MGIEKSASPLFCVGNGLEAWREVEVEFAGDEVCHRDEVVGIAAASRPTFGGLDETVDGLEDPVADPGLEPVEDACPVVADGTGQFDERS